MINKYASVTIAAIVIGNLIAVIIFFSIPFYWRGDKYLNMSANDAAKSEKSVGDFNAKGFIILQKKWGITYIIQLNFHDDDPSQRIYNTISKNILYLGDTAILSKEKVFDGQRTLIYCYIWPMGRLKICGSQ